MADNQNDIEGRVTALERDVNLIRQDAAAARVLAGGADRDVTEIRAEIRDFRQATTGSLNALRETQIEHGQRLATLERRVDQGFAKVDDGFTEVRGRLDATAAGLQQIATLLNTLIGQQEH